jgi:hypothetical protein
MAHACCVAGLQTNPHAVSDRNKANQRAYFIVHCAMGETSGAVCPRARGHAHVETHIATVVHARTQTRCTRAHMRARVLTHTSLHNSAARQTAVGLRRPPYSSELSTLHLASRRTPGECWGGGGGMVLAGKADIGFAVLKIPQPVNTTCCTGISRVLGSGGDWGV